MRNMRSALRLPRDDEALSCSETNVLSESDIPDDIEDKDFKGSGVFRRRGRENVDFLFCAISNWSTVGAVVMIAGAVKGVSSCSTTLRSRFRASLPGGIGGEAVLS